MPSAARSFFVSARRVPESSGHLREVHLARRCRAARAPRSRCGRRSRGSSSSSRRGSRASRRRSGSASSGTARAGWRGRRGRPRGSRGRSGGRRWSWCLPGPAVIGTVEPRHYRSYHRRFTAPGDALPCLRRRLLAEIQPFAGIQYRDADLSRVLAPPYDVIPPAYRDELYARDPHNIVRVILNRDARRRGVRGGGGDLPALAGRGRAAGGRGARPLRPRAELRRRRPDAAAVRPARPLPGRGPGAAGHPAPRAHARGGEGGPLARAQRHEGQLQPDLPHVPRPAAPLRGPRARGDRPPAGRAVHRRRRGGAPDVARRGAGPRRPLPGPARRREVLHRRRAPPPRDGAALPRRGRPRRRVDARLLHADRGAGARGAAVPPHPVGGAVARGRGAGAWRADSG